MARSRVLVVDDDRAMTRAVRRALESTHTVTEAQTPDDALAALEREAPELAILDISMPVMSGFALMGRLRERRPDLDILFMTGSVDAENVHMIEAIRKGAFYYIQKPFQSELLSALVGRCLELRSARRELEERHRVQEEQLAEARDFQRSMLPATRLEWAPLEIRTYYQPCHQVGGDFCDHLTVEAPDRFLAVVVADVSGKGAGAAMLTSAIRYAFRTAASDAYIPHVVVHRMLATLPNPDSKRHATATCLRIHPHTRCMDYVNAGHQPMLILRADGTLHSVAATGLPVGSLMAQVPLEQAQIPFRPGDRLLLFSDGVVDCRNERKEMFEAGRLEAAVHAARASGRSLLDEVVERLDAFRGSEPPFDDVTLVEIVFKG